MMIGRELIWHNFWWKLLALFLATVVWFTFHSGDKLEFQLREFGSILGSRDFVQHPLTLKSFTKLGRPLLLGASRKSFIGKLTGDPGEERLSGSLACAIWGVEHGAQIIRAHDIAETKRALRVIDLLAKPAN